MSTKAIEKALRAYEKHVSPGTYGSALASAAGEELEAIRKAAGEVRVWGIGPVRLPQELSGFGPSDEYRAECERQRLEAYETLKAVAAQVSP